MLVNAEDQKAMLELWQDLGKLVSIGVPYSAGLLFLFCCVTIVTVESAQIV